MKSDLPSTLYPLPSDKSKAKRILLKTRKQVYGDMLGNNASLFEGEGFEFTELREYLYGDDVRKIDWKTTAKLGKPYVKVYREERELNVVVVTMLGGSMYFGTVRQKSETAAEAVATIGFSATKNSDLFSHYLFADESYEIVKPTKKLYGVYDSVASILSFSPIGKRNDFAAMEAFLRKRLRKKALLFIVSDFVGEIDLKYLAKKHDLFAVIVRDRFEEEPGELGYLRLVDPENGRGVEGSVDEAALKRYRAALRKNDERLYKHLRRTGARFAKVYTHEDAAVKLAKAMR